MVQTDQLGVPVLKTTDMPFVKFTTVTEENKLETKAHGKMVWTDRHYAIITVPGTRGDNQIELVDKWWGKLDEEVKRGRVLSEWVIKWKADFQRYLAGQEIPLHGTPIRGWKLITGSQQEMLIQANILTVEALANLSADARQHIGMGALEMQRRAQAWLEQNTNSEAATLKMSAMEAENATLKETVQGLMEKVETLSKMVGDKKKG